MDFYKACFHTDPWREIFIGFPAVSRSDGSQAQEDDDLKVIVIELLRKEKK